MKNVFQKAISIICLASLALGHFAYADSSSESSSDSTAMYSCMIMGANANGTKYDQLIHKGTFSWTVAKETSLSFFNEKSLFYQINSQANSGFVSFSIFNIETQQFVAVLGDMNKALLLFDSANKRIFGCGVGSEGEIQSLLSAQSVK